MSQRYPDALDSRDQETVGAAIRTHYQADEITVTDTGPRLAITVREASNVVQSRLLRDLQAASFTITTITQCPTDDYLEVKLTQYLTEGNR